MPRQRILTDDIVLDRATRLFWQRGYAATTLRDLTAATGLSTAALYHRFDDKDGLFVRVVRHYADQGLSQRLERLSAMTSPVRAIRTWFDELVAASADDPQHRGCLLVNTVLDGATMSAAARAMVRSRLGEVEAFFRNQLVRAKVAGQIDPAIRPAALAETLLATVLAIRVLARLDPDRKRLQRLARQALAPLTLKLKAKAS